MNLTNLKQLFADNDCDRIYVKKLSPNDNSKNQVYFGGSFEVLNILPIREIKAEAAGDWERERFKASVDFSWIGEDGNLYPAPKAQLILYPKYPEVRFSGFLQNCTNPPSDLMATRLSNRLLFLGVTSNKTVLGYVVAPDSEIASEFNSISLSDEEKLFKTIELTKTENSRERLLSELSRIHNTGWIESKRLKKIGELVPCEASQCGGYTLEAELGIITNASKLPDYLGWEIKNFGVQNLNRIDSKVITLITPEPTGGVYKEIGMGQFVRKYGYADLSGKPDRMNFGGIYKSGIRQKRTKMQLELIGFDKDSGKIRSVDGAIVLLDINDNIAASWSFSTLLEKWNRKHNQACFVPSIVEKIPVRKYKYSNNVLLGVGTDFQLFLSEMAKGNVYYDPGIKVENISTKPDGKPRSQFRTKSRFLRNIYKSFEVVDVS